MKFTWRSTLPSLATLNLSYHLSEELYLIKSQKKIIFKEFSFRDCPFSSNLSYADVVGLSQYPSRTSLTWSCQRGTAGLSCCCCCCFQTWGPQIWKISQENWVCQISRKQRGALIFVFLAPSCTFLSFSRGVSASRVFYRSCKILEIAWSCQKKLRNERFAFVLLL